MRGLAAQAYNCRPICVEAFDMFQGSGSLGLGLCFDISLAVGSWVWSLQLHKARAYDAIKGDILKAPRADSA